MAGKTTDFFYKEIVEPFINGLKQEIEYTFFDIRDYEKPLRNNDPNEMTDLANQPKHQEKIKVLFKDLIELRKTMDDVLDLQGTYDK